MGKFYIRNHLVECFIASTGQYSNPHSIGSLHYDTDAAPLRYCGSYYATVAEHAHTYRKASINTANGSCMFGVLFEFVLIKVKNKGD